jgi:hypothetical protein
VAYFKLITFIFSNCYGLIVNMNEINAHLN